MYKLIILLTIAVTDGFRIINHTTNNGLHSPGGKLKMVCTSDKSWEYCAWRHKVPAGRQNVVRECHMEWKRLKKGVQKQACHPEITNRVKILGDYDKHECGIQIDNLQLQDGGEWECEMEAYVLFGGKGSGQSRKKSFQIFVSEPVTTTLKTSTIEEETSDEATSTTISTVDDAVTTSTQTFADTTQDVSATKVTKIESTTTEHGDVEQTTTTYSVYEDDNTDLLNSTDDRSRMGDVSNSSFAPYKISAVTQQDLDEDDEGVPLAVILVPVALVLVVGAAMAGGIFYLKNRRGYDNIVSMQKLKENGVGTEGFLFEDDVNSSIHANNMPNPTMMEK